MTELKPDQDEGDWLDNVLLEWSLMVYLASLSMIYPMFIAPDQEQSFFGSFKLASLADSVSGHLQAAEQLCRGSAEARESTSRM